jgi:hypothetical protein
VPWVPIALAAPFVLIALLLLAAIVGLNWFPVHDFAFLELRIRDIGTADTPLVGSYSRFGWSHPGPFLDYLLAVPYWLTGRSSSGLLAGAVLVNVAAVVASIAVAWRRGGGVLAACTALVLALLLSTLGADFLVSPWNPYVTVVPFVLLLLLAWSLSVGDLVAAPFAVGVGSVLVQGHVEYALPVGAAIIYALTWFLVDRRSRPAEPARRRSDRRLWIVTAAVGAVVWLPSALDQVAGSGNLVRIGRHFASGAVPSAGLRSGARIGASELLPWGPWTGRSVEANDAFTGQLTGTGAIWLVVPVATLAVAAVVARRYGPPGALRMIGLAAIGLATTTLAFSRISLVAYGYLVRWSWGMAAFVWLAVAYPFAMAGARFVARRALTARVRLAGGGAALVVVVVSAMLVTMTGLGDPQPPEAERGAVVGSVRDDVLAAVEGEGGAVLVRPENGEFEVFPAPSARQLAAGLALQLERAGVAVRVVDQDWEVGPGSGGALLFGDQRAGTGHTAGMLTVVNGRSIDTYVPPAGARKVASYADPILATVDVPALERELEQAFRSEGYPEIADKVSRPDLSWSFLGVAGLADYHDEVSLLLEARAAPRVEVWWLPAELR